MTHEEILEWLKRLLLLSFSPFLVDVQFIVGR
jgi:hypothetical protein